MIEVNQNTTQHFHISVHSMQYISISKYVRTKLSQVHSQHACILTISTKTNISTQRTLSCQNISQHDNMALLSAIYNYITYQTMHKYWKYIISLTHHPTMITQSDYHRYKHIIWYQTIRKYCKYIITSHLNQNDNIKL